MTNFDEKVSFYHTLLREIVFVCEDVSNENC